MYLHFCFFIFFIFLNYYSDTSYHVSHVLGKEPLYLTLHNI